MAREIEKLKHQLARLRSQNYGSLSQRIEREIGQLEFEARRARGRPRATEQFPSLTVVKHLRRVQPIRGRSRSAAQSRSPGASAKRCRCWRRVAIKPSR